MKFDFSDVAQATNDELAQEIAGLTTMSPDDVARLFPRKVDKKQLQDLMTIVQSATSNNNKVAKIRQNFTQLGGALLKIAKQVIPA